MVGNNVSHANNKTKRRFLPNITETSVYSDLLKERVRIKVSASGLRTLDKKGGLDAFLLGTSKTKLDPSLKNLRSRVEKAKQEQAA